MNLQPIFKLAGLRRTPWKIVQTGPLPGMANLESMGMDAGVFGIGVGGGEVVLRNRASRETVSLRYVSGGGSVGAGFGAPVNIGVNIDSLGLPSGALGAVYAGAGSMWDLGREDFSGFLDLLTISKDGPVTGSITLVIFNPIPVPVPNPNPAFGAVHFVSWLIGLKGVSVLAGLGTNIGNVAGIGAELHRGWARVQ